MMWTEAVSTSLKPSQKEHPRSGPSTYAYQLGVLTIGDLPPKYIAFEESAWKATLVVEQPQGWTRDICCRHLRHVSPAWRFIYEHFPLIRVTCDCFFRRVRKIAKSDY